MRLQHLAVSVFALLFCTTHALATDQWTTGGPYGGDISTILVDPARHGVWYAGARNGAGLFTSVDGGATWSLHNGNVAALGGPFGIAALAATIENGHSVLYQASNDGLLRSEDGGNTWAWRDSGITSWSFRTVAADPTNPSTIYAGTGQSLFRSTDAGLSWAPITGPLGINAITLDEKRPGAVFIGTDNGIFASLDGGDTWSDFHCGLDATYVTSVVLLRDRLGYTSLAITVRPGLFGPTRIWMRDVYPRAVGCWRKIDFQDGLFGPVMITDAAASGTLYVTSYDALGTVWATDDRGRTWRRLSKGDEPRDFETLMVDPESGTLWGGTSGDGIVAATPTGWVTYNEGLSAVDIGTLRLAGPNSTILYAATRSSGCFRSDDAGASWRRISGGLPSNDILSLAVDPSDPNILYAGLGRTLYTSVDGGLTWTKLAAAPVPNFSGPLAIAIDPSHPSTVYFSSHNGVHRSTDRGATWTSTSMTSYTNGLFIDPLDPNTIFARGSYSGGSRSVARSRDGGTTWTVLSSLASGQVTALAFEPGSAGAMFASTADGGALWRSADRGDTWTRIGSLPPLPQLAMACDPRVPGLMYLAVYQLGLGQSTNGGASFSGYVPAVPLRHVLQIAVPPDGTALYVGTAGGVFSIEP
jgi:photosystem II stability/assembly factor-like uncharacterized protein